MLFESQSASAFLSEELARRIRTNSRYSQRAFARQLGLSPGELSEVLRGKRALSLRSALRIAKALGLNATETRHLVQISLPHDARSPLNDDVTSRQLTLDMFHVVSDWFCFAILTLSECEGFRWSESWIARRLGISRAETAIALQRLERVGLIERNGSRLEVTRDYVIAPAGIPSEAIRSYHRQILAKAIQAVDGQAVDEREFSGIGIAIDPKRLPALKKEISCFQDEIVAKYSKGNKTEVYYLETALFRLTPSSQRSSS